MRTPGFEGVIFDVDGVLVELAPRTRTTGLAAGVDGRRVVRYPNTAAGELPPGNRRTGMTLSYAGVRRGACEQLTTVLARFDARPNGKASARDARSAQPSTEFRASSEGLPAGCADGRGVLVKAIDLADDDV